MTIAPSVNVDKSLISKSVNTIEKSLDEYCQRAVATVAHRAFVIDPRSVVTAPWVRWKCQFGCSGYGKSYSCPPYSPTPEQTRQLLDNYNRAILFYMQWTQGVQTGRDIRNFQNNTVAMERELFLDGFYRAFAMPAGACWLCKECAIVKNEPCVFREKARPCMEASGIDVYQTAHNHGMPLYTLRTREETANVYNLLLVD